MSKLAVTQTPVKKKPSANTDVKNSKGVNNNNKSRREVSTKTLLENGKRLWNM